jgi:hypothetical protein
MEIEITESRFVWISYYFFLAIYYIAFVWVSYGIFWECRLDRHFWIVPDIFNGILGGMILVYPFNVFRYGFQKTLDRLILWFIVYTGCFVITAMIGGLFGIGGMR